MLIYRVIISEVKYNGIIYYNAVLEIFVVPHRQRQLLFTLRCGDVVVVRKQVANIPANLHFIKKIIPKK